MVGLQAFSQLSADDFGVADPQLGLVRCMLKHSVKLDRAQCSTPACRHSGCVAVQQVTAAPG